MTPVTIIATLKRIWPALGLAAIGLLIFLLVRCTDRAQDHAVSQAKDAGSAQQRADDATTTIQRTQEANNAAETVRRDRDAWRAQCLRHARNPNDCD